MQNSKFKIIFQKPYAPQASNIPIIPRFPKFPRIPKFPRFSGSLGLFFDFRGANFDLKKEGSDG